MFGTPQLTEFLVEPSLSDNKNTVTTDRTELLNETIVSLSRMKVYARSKGGTHNSYAYGSVCKTNKSKLAHMLMSKLNEENADDSKESTVHVVDLLTLI